MQKKLIIPAVVLLILLCLGVAVLAAVSLWDLNREYQAGETDYDAIRLQKSALLSESGFSGRQFAALAERCPGLAAWITIENTPIDYPVMQAQDNETYLRLTADGQENTAGSIFLDCRNSSDFSDYNSILFGHALKSGRMFGSLKEYLNPAYRDAHPEIILLLPGGERRYEIFAVGKTTAGSAHYTRTLDKASDAKTFLDYVKAEAIYDTGITPAESDRLLTLSTCTNGKADERYVILARESAQ